MNVNYNAKDAKPYKVDDCEFENFSEAKAHIDAAVLVSDLDDDLDFEDLISNRV